MDRINKGTINVSDRSHLKEKSLSSGSKQRISEITSEPIFNEEKKATAIPQDKPLIERKIEQLKTQGRNYIVRQDNKSADISNTSIQSSTDILSEDFPGILQYLSKGDLININGNAKNLYDQKPIECRHLAYAFATDEFGTKETGKFSSIAGVGKIARHKGIKTDQELKDSFLFKTAQEGYYFDRDGVGQAIYAVCLRQKTLHEQTKGYLFHSLNHMMALKINWSPEQPEIKLTFYDPNDTLRVRRLVVSDLQTLKTIKVEDLIPNSYNIEYYYPEHSFGGSLTKTVVKSPKGNPPAVPAVYTTLLTAITTRFWSYLGYPKTAAQTDVKQCGNQKTIIATSLMQQWSQETSGIAGNPLIWTSSDINSSMLHSMLTQGHFSPKIAEKVKEQLKKCDPENRIDLLMAKCNDGFPGLYMALQNGHKECVETYCKMIIDSKIFSNEEKLALLMAKTDNGFSGLYVALQNGHKDSVETYCKLIIDSNILSNDEKRTLLMAKSDTGDPGLLIAMENGHKDSVETYCKLIIDSNIFSNEEKLALLMAKSDDGVSGLYMALQNGHKECVETYCKLVIDSNIFSDEEKLTLLMTKTAEGVSGLYMALHNGYEECVKKYCNLVMASAFSDEWKMKLVTARHDPPVFNSDQFFALRRFIRTLGYR